MAYHYMTRLEQIEVDGEVAEVRLVVFRDEDHVHINEGDEFVTIQTKVDLFAKTADEEETS